MKKILITGINGFIGRSLTELLKKNNYYIIGIDVQKKSELRINEYYKCDITDKSQLLKIKTDVDYVVHLVALTNVKVNKDLMYKVNVIGTENICELAKKLKVKKIIYLSTVSVFSDFNEKYITENSDTEPLNYYGQTKLEAENRIKNSELNYTILRPTNIFGKGSDKFKNYFNRVKNKIIFYKNRIPHLVYIKDVVEIILFCIKNNKTDNEIFIVSDNEQKYTEKKVFDILLNVYKLNNKLIPYPLFWKKYDNRIFKSEKLKKIYTFKYGVKKGLTNYLKEKL